jgi:hypothetical protein
MKKYRFSLLAAGLLLPLLLSGIEAAPAPSAVWPREYVILKGHDHGARALAFSPDGKLLVSGGNCDCSIRLWNVASGKNTAILKHSTRKEDEKTLSVTAVAFGSDGKILASGGTDKIIQLWDVASSKNIASFKGHQGDRRGQIDALAFSPNGKSLASISSFETVRCWDLKSKKERKESKLSFTELMPAVAFVSTDTPLVAFLRGTPGNRTFVLKPVGSDVPLLSCTGHKNLDVCSSFDFSRDGKRAASTGLNTARVWNTATGENLFTFTLPERSAHFRSPALSPDGKTLACVSGFHIKTLRFYDLSSGKLLASKEIHAVVRCLTFSPDGRVLAACDGWNLKLWRLPDRFKRE